MTQQANIKIVLDAVNNASKALEDVRKQLEDVGSTADNATKSTGGFGAALNNVGDWVAGMAGTYGLGYFINQATESDKSLVRLQLSLGRYGEGIRNQLIPQVLQAGKTIEGMGLASDEMASETIGRLLPTFKNDLPRAINGASTLLTLMKYDVHGASAVLNFLGEDSDFARMGMLRLAKAVGIDVNPKMDDLGELLEKIQRRFIGMQMPPFVEEFGKLIGHLETLAENVGAKILMVVNPMLGLLNMILDLPIVGEVMAWATAFLTVALSVGMLAKFLGLVPDALFLVKGAWGLLSDAFAAAAGFLGIPVWGVVLIIAGLVALGIAIYETITHWDKFKEIIKAVWDAVIAFTKTAWEWIVMAVKISIKAIYDAFVWLFDKMLYILGWAVGSVIKFFTVDLPNGITWFAMVFVPKAIDAIVMFFATLPARIGAALAALPSIISNIFNSARTIVSSILNDIMKWVGDLPNRMLSGITTGINWVVDRINSFVSGFNAAVPKGMEIHPIPHLATGGIVNRPTVALIGEAGAEAVIPLSRMGSMGGGGGQIIIDMTGSLFLSENVAVQIGDKIIDRLRKTMRIPSRSF